MSIDYQVQGDITEAVVLAAWPTNAPAEVEKRLLSVLVEALDAALLDALAERRELGALLRDMKALAEQVESDE